jgi:amidase
VTPETTVTMQESTRGLEAAGANLIDTPLPDEGWDLTRAVWESYGGEMTTGDLYRLLRHWDWYRSAMLEWFRDYGLILRPVSATPAPEIGRTNVDTLYTVPFSMTGWPAAVVRAGTSPEGLPIGAQIVAHPWRDHVALAAARQIERVLGGWSPPTLTRTE